MPNEIQTVQSGGSLAAPQVVKKGLTAVRVDKLKIPRLKLAQDLTDEVKKLGVAKPGDFINNLTLENHGTRIEVIACLQTMSRNKWIDFKDGGGIDCRSRDGLIGEKYGSCLKCEFASNWSKNQKGQTVPPSCSEQDNFILMDRSTMQPLLFAFTKSGASAGQKLVSMLACLRENEPIWSRAFVIESKNKAYGATSCFVPTVSLSPQNPTDIEMEAAEAICDRFMPHQSEIAEAAESASAEEGEGSTPESTVPVTARKEKKNF